MTEFVILAVIFLGLALSVVAMVHYHNSGK